jgi:type VI protein secretion system component Hcp
MSQSEKPASEKATTAQNDQPLPEAELEKVAGGTEKASGGTDKASGGKTSLGPIIFTKHYDKSSPYLG